MKSNDPVCLELVCKRRPIRNTGIIRCAINLRPNVCKNGHLLATPPLCNLTKNVELFAASLSDSRAYLELIEPRIFFLQINSTAPIPLAFPSLSYFTIIFFCDWYGQKNNQFFSFYISIKIISFK